MVAVSNAIHTKRLGIIAKLTHYSIFEKKIVVAAFLNPQMGKLGNNVIEEATANDRTNGWIHILTINHKCDYMTEKLTVYRQQCSESHQHQV